MKMTEVKKLYFYELRQKIEKWTKDDPIPYPIRSALEELCENGLYVRQWRECKKVSFLMRLTFLPFLIGVLLLWIISFFKWMFTGEFGWDPEEQWFVNFLVKWQKKGNFNFRF